MYKTVRFEYCKEEKEVEEEVKKNCKLDIDAERNALLNSWKLQTTIAFTQSQLLKTIIFK